MKSLSASSLLCVFHSCAALSKSELIRWSRDLTARNLKSDSTTLIVYIIQNEKYRNTKEHYIYEKKKVQTIVEWSWAVLVTIGQSRETLNSILSLWSLHQLSVVRWNETMQISNSSVIIIHSIVGVFRFTFGFDLTVSINTFASEHHISTHFNI